MQYEMKGYKMKSILISDDLHYQVKQLCASKRLTMHEFIEESVQEKCDRDGIKLPEKEKS